MDGRFIHLLVPFDTEIWEYALHMNQLTALKMLDIK